MELIRNFTALGKGDAAIAGGKGASLGEMTKAGIPVPPGFVILASAFERFLDEASLQAEIDTIVLHGVNKDAMHTVEHASERIQKLILEADMPQDIAQEIEKHFGDLGAQWVAVRSSATAEDSASAAWAGQLDSFLNTNHETLLLNVKRCWASLFTPRAIFYRFEKELHTQKISVAVVVQKMIESEVSGIAFSVHPVTEDRNQLIAEAGFGLGEAIVSGQVTPDSYVVEKTPRRILDINISTQTRQLCRAEGGGNEWHDIAEPKASSSALSEEQIQELADLIVKIEDHYGFPCDIEWAFEGGKFYIVQSRPITTLTPTVAEEKNEHTFNSPELQGFKPEEWLYMGMYKQSPFALSFWGFYFDDAPIKAAGFDLPNIGNIVMRDGAVVYSKVAHGQIEAQLRNLIERKDLAPLEVLHASAKDAYEKAIAFAASLSSAEVTEASLKEVLTHAKRIILFWEISAAHLNYSMEKIAQEQIIADTFPIEAVPSLTPQVETPSTLQARDFETLRQIVSGKTKDEIQNDPVLSSAVEAHAKTYAWVEIANWVGSPLLSGHLIDLLLAERPSAQTQQPLPPLSEKMTTIRAVLAHVLYMKQAGAEYASMFQSIVRPYFERLCEKIGISYDQMLRLTYDEVEAVFLGRISKEEALRVGEERGDRYIFIGTTPGKQIKIQDPADVEYLTNFWIPKADPSTTFVRGHIGNKGKAVGPARILRGVEDFHKMKEGDVLVTTMTTPEYVLLMQKASAIVTNMGGLLCHAAIVSRELNKPCVINTKIGTELFKDGDILEVDANEGVVRIQKHAES